MKVNKTFISRYNKISRYVVHMLKIIRRPFIIHNLIKGRFLGKSVAAEYNLFMERLPWGPAIERRGSILRLNQVREYLKQLMRQRCSHLPAARGLSDF